jgi:hypothetical protein
VENYYGATSDEAALASQFFATYGSSAEMLFIRFPLGGNRAHLYWGQRGQQTDHRAIAGDKWHPNGYFSRVPLFREDQS